MKRVIAILICIFMAFSISSCGSSGNSLEEKYCKTAQEYAEKGDIETALKVIDEGLSKIPDSEKLTELKEKITSEEAITEVETTEAQTSSVPTEESVIKDFKTLRMLYRKWFEMYEFEYDRNAGVKTENFDYKYPVNDTTVKSKSDLDNLFLRYCNESLYKLYRERSHARFVDENGSFYCVMPDAFGYAVSADIDIIVEKMTDTEYLLSYVEEVTNEGYVDRYSVSLSYYLCTDGVWRFGTETRVYLTQVEGDDNEDYDYSDQQYSDGQQIVEDIVDGAINGLDNFVNEII